MLAGCAFTRLGGIELCGEAPCGSAGQRGPLVGLQLAFGIYLALNPHGDGGTCGVGLVGAGHRP
jgi:hypothetical protein